MIQERDYISLIIKQYFKKYLIGNNININDCILDKVSEDSHIQESLSIIIDKINTYSDRILPILKLNYKITNLSISKNKIPTLKYIDIPVEEQLKYEILKIDGLDEVGGLRWNIDSQSFEGFAQNSGSFELKIEGIYNISEQIKQKTFGCCILTVIPDPKSLWKTVEPDSSILYRKPHEESESMVSCSGDRLLFVSKRGRSHAHAGTYRDDDGKLLVTDNGWSLIAIADGGGSYSLSRRGSKIAVDNSINALQKVLSGGLGEELEKAFFKNEELQTNESNTILEGRLKDTILSAAFTGLHAIKQEANETGNNLKDYSTTLLLGAHKKTSLGHIIISFWVGDGVIAVYSEKESVVLLGEPDGGEFAGQTRFLDDSFFHDNSRISIKLIPKFSAFILATDGISDPYFETDKSLYSIERWDEFWKNISDIVVNEDIKVAEKELLKWLDFWSAGNHDDRSLALLLPDFNINKKQNNESLTQLSTEKIDGKNDEKSQVENTINIPIIVKNSLNDEEVMDNINTRLNGENNG